MSVGHSRLCDLLFISATLQVDMLTEPAYDIRTIVLKNNLDEAGAMEMAEQKKTTMFGSRFSKVKKEGIQIHSLELYYECVLIVSGRYTSDYYVKVTHTISVASNVKDVALGDGTFLARSKSGLEKAVPGRRGRNKVDLELEEHVFVDEEDELAFDHHGIEIQIPFKMDSKTIENYPRQILEKNEKGIRRSKMTYGDAVNRLAESLKTVPDSSIRGVQKEFTLREIVEAYIPVYEIRLIGPSKKATIMRIDAVRKKVL